MDMLVDCELELTANQKESRYAKQTLEGVPQFAKAPREWFHKGDG
jgi:hypothetical protein